MRNEGHIIELVSEPPEGIQRSGGSIDNPLFTKATFIQLHVAVVPEGIRIGDTIYSDNQAEGVRWCRVSGDEHRGLVPATFNS